MANEILSRDQNHVTVLGGVTDDANQYVTMLRVDPTTKRLLISATGVGSGTVTSISQGTGILLSTNPITTTGSVSLATSLQPMATLAGNSLKVLRVNAGETAVEYSTASSGTVTSVSVVTANGVSGSVATATTTPAITLTLGAITPTTVNGLTISTTTGTLTVTNGKTLSISNTLTFTGTDSSSVNFGTGGTVLYTTSTIPLTVGSTTIASGTDTRILYDNAGVLGEYTLTGSGTVVAMQTAPSFLTSITTPSVLASANDSGAIGASGTAFSDLFLASGAVINFNAGNVTLTHSAGILTQNAGELRITSANVGTNADSVPTLSSTSTLTNKTLTSPTLTTPSAFTTGGTITLAENTSIALDPAGSADGKYTGITIAGTAGATLAFGDLVYLSSVDSRWELADADSVTTADRMMGMCVLAAAADGDPTTLLLMGQIRADAVFPALTIGSAVYVGETAGDIQVAIPTGADNVIRRVGYALTADEIYFNPSMDSQTTVA